MIKEDKHLHMLVLAAIDKAIECDPAARHPRVPVNRVTNNVMLSAHLQGDDRSSVMGEVCAAALHRGYVVEFEVYDDARA
jgi:hypothetical protein